MHQNEPKPNLEIFAQTLLECAQKDRNIYVITSDSRGSGKLVSFGEQIAEQLIEVGIAEQNVVGIAAGMASTGKKVFAVSPASFLTTRALEQIKNDVAYSDQPVTLVGISAGVSYGALGSTHHSLHDLAALRAINNVDIVVPADNFETRETIKAAVNYLRPLYIRFGKRRIEHLYQDHATFQIGKANLLRKGQDIAFIAIGETVVQAVNAADKLKEHSITARVLSMHTLRPLDKQAILSAGQECRAVITVEEHSVHGGLGEACAGILMQNNVSVPFHIAGIADEYTATGSQLDIFSHYGLTGDGLFKKAMQFLNSRKG